MRPEKVSWSVGLHRVASRRLSLRRSTPPFERHGRGAGHTARILKVRALSALMTMSIYGEERERKQFVAAVKDGYVLCE